MTKNIIFLWLGHHIPSFSDRVIQEFSNMNPDFDIIFEHHTAHDIFIPSSKRIYQVANEAIYKKSPYQKVFDFNVQRHLPFIQNIADIYRLDMLNKFGGIYVDLDTFPIRPFNTITDDQFVVKRKYQGQIIKDCYFMGRDINSSPIYDFRDVKTTYFDPGEDDKIKEMRAKMQFKKELPLELTDNFYIRHFELSYWKNNLVERSIYD